MFYDEYLSSAISTDTIALGLDGAFHIWWENVILDQLVQVRRQKLKLSKRRFNMVHRLFSHGILTYNSKQHTVCSYMEGK